MEDVNNSQLLVDEVLERYFKTPQEDSYFAFGGYLLFQTFPDNIKVTICSNRVTESSFEPYIRVYKAGIMLYQVNLPKTKDKLEAEESCILWADGYITGFKYNTHYYKNSKIESKKEPKIEGTIGAVYPADSFSEGLFQIYTDGNTGPINMIWGNRYIAPFGTFNVIRHV